MTMLICVWGVTGPRRCCSCQDDTGNSRCALPGDSSAWSCYQHGGAAGRLLDWGRIL